MNEFRLRVDLFGDEGNFGLLVVTDNRNKAWNQLPSESFAMENATPEEVGKLIAEYLKRNCT